MVNHPDSVMLERLVDEYGLNGIIEQLGILCAEKADHIKSYADSEYLVTDWENASHVLIRQFAEHRSIKKVSP